MSPLPTSGGDLGHSTKKEPNKENSFSSLPDKVWDWKWDYGEFYDANGYNTDGQKTTSGLSTESPFYFMEFYNQDRSNDGMHCHRPILNYVYLSMQLDLLFSSSSNTKFVSVGCQQKLLQKMLSIVRMDLVPKVGSFLTLLSHFYQNSN